MDCMHIKSRPQESKRNTNETKQCYQYSYNPKSFSNLKLYSISSLKHTIHFNLHEYLLRGRTLSIPTLVKAY